jgi:hypothetical protein
VYQEKGMKEIALRYKNIWITFKHDLMLRKENTLPVIKTRLQYSTPKNKLFTKPVLASGVVQIVGLQPYYFHKQQYLSVVSRSKWHLDRI